MPLDREKISNLLIYISAFINFFGFYDFLLLALNAGIKIQTTLISVPTRSLSLLSLMLLFLIRPNNKNKAPRILFAIFSFIYIAQIFAHILLRERYHLSPYVHLFYFLSYAVLPFMLLSSIKVRAGFYESMRKALLFSGLIFSVLVISFYRKYIGAVDRLSSSSAEDSALSPLILSYCSTLAIGIASGYWMENKIKTFEKVYLVILIFLSTIPFFLGASRGSIFSLVVPFIVMLALKENLATKLKIAFTGIVTMIALILLSEQFGGGVFDRFTGISSGIETNDSSSVRIFLWRQSLREFMEFPIFGYGFDLVRYNIYPHNILLESLQSVGIVGSIPFFALLFITFKKTVKIFKFAPQYSWIGIIFIQAFMQNMFSGSIYFAGWLWFSAALLLALDINHARENFKLGSCA